MLVLGEAAPPVAEQACEEGGIRALLKAVVATGPEDSLMEHLLQALECLLSTPAALRSFCGKGGHAKLLDLMQTSTSPGVLLHTSRVFAAALSHEETPGVDDGTWTESSSDSESKSSSESGWSGSRSAEGAARKSVVRIRSSAEIVAIGNTEGSSESDKPSDGPRYSSIVLRLRVALWENGLLDMLSSAMDHFGKKHLGLAEATAGALLNLTISVASDEEGQPPLKQDAGHHTGLYVGVAEHWIENETRRPQAARLAVRMLELLCSVCQDTDAAVALHRHSGATKALTWMRAYPEDPAVQRAGCAFLQNFVTRKFRFKEAVLVAGGFQQVLPLLRLYLQRPEVLCDVMRALQRLIDPGTSPGPLQDAHVVDTVFEAMGLHPDSQELHEASIGLFWSLAAIPDMVRPILELHGIDHALEAIACFESPGFVVHVAGMLRNLFACGGACGRDAGCAFRDANGVRILLKPLWRYTTPRISKVSRSGRPSRMLYLGEEDEAPKLPPENVAVAEQVLAALNNFSALPSGCSVHLANELIDHGECAKLRQVLERIPESSMVQYQGLMCMGRVLSARRDMKHLFDGTARHATLMIQQYRRTPVADIAELILEEVF
uniref:Uncharacterized protein n=1 Tax=Alexandrium monilatum TaxID=311494 RepID=A0A7S4V834_9DINO